MGMIPNIPNDISRTPAEKSKPVKPLGTKPVQHSEAIHPIQRHDSTPTERRTGNKRRKQAALIKQNKRLLTERRQKLPTGENDDLLSELAHRTGSIIDLEV